MAAISLRAQNDPRARLEIFVCAAIRYNGHTLRSDIEAPLISREVLPETHFLSVIMAAYAQAGPFL